MKKYKFKITSGITALAVGLIIGWYLSTILGVFLSSSFVNYMWAFMVVVGLAFIYWDYKHPTVVETIGYIFSIFVVLQSLFWDFPAGDINTWRVRMFLLAFGLLIWNSFTGHLRWKAGIRFFKRATGWGK